MFRTALVIGLAAGAASNAAAQDKLKIGMVMPLTGALAGAGQQVVAGARFYMAQHGDTVAGRKIELIVKDDGTVPDVGRRLTQELIVNDKIDVLAGGLTADLMASAALITEAKKPTVIMLASTTSLIEKSPYFVRTSCTMAQSSAMMADWAVKNGMTRVVTLVSDFAPAAW
jgi:branched-chain amino acid transport system substrate-binding protein